MKIRLKNINIRKARQFINFELALCSLFFILFSSFSYSQDSIPAQKDLTEEAELKFQGFFFKALSQKSIGNHQKAIENLESCNQISPNDVSVFFEFSKNYLELKNMLLAKEYINRALEKHTDDLWMQKHLVKIHRLENDLDKAIEVQKNIVEKYPKERVFLTRLYLYNRNYQEALALIDILEKENALPANLKAIKNNLAQRNRRLIKPKKSADDVATLIENFKTDKSYSILKKILTKSEGDTKVLLQYADEGIALFPAQPYVYLIKGKTLNQNKNHQKALVALQNGIDFVIDDEMEANFYMQMAIAYKALGNSKEEKKYSLKAKKLKI